MIAGAVSVRKPKTFVDRLPKPLRPFFKDGDYQNRVLALALSILFFIIPSMVAGGLALYQIFLSPHPEIPMDSKNNILVPDTLDLFIPRLVVIGIFFCIGIFIILFVTRGYADLENVLTVIGFFTVSAGAVLSGVISYRCLVDLSCEGFRFIAGIICILVLTGISFILPAGVGKRFWGYTLVFIPVLLYEVVGWSYYLLLDNQALRSTDGVLKATLMLFITAGLAILFALGGGGASRSSRSQ